MNYCYYCEKTIEKPNNICIECLQELEKEYLGGKYE